MKKIVLLITLFTPFKSREKEDFLKFKCLDFIYII